MADHYSFSVVLEPQEGGSFTVLVPALPEVVTEGDTEQEALAMPKRPFAPSWPIGAIMGSPFEPTRLLKSGA